MKKIGLALSIIGILILLAQIYFNAKNGNDDLFFLTPIGLLLVSLGVYIDFKNKKDTKEQ